MKIMRTCVLCEDAYKLFLESSIKEKELILKNDNEKKLIMDLKAEFAEKNALKETYTTQKREVDDELNRLAAEYDKRFGEEIESIAPEVIELWNTNEIQDMCEAKKRLEEDFTNIDKSLRKKAIKEEQKVRETEKRMSKE